MHAPSLATQADNPRSSKADENGETYGTEGEVRNHEEEPRQYSPGECWARAWSAKEEEELGSRTASQKTTF